MTPTHTNKKGVRYSYYVSQTVLRKRSAGSIGRVAAPELEALVVDAVRRHLQANSTAPNPILETDRELIERHLLRATLSMKAITLHLLQEIADSEASGPDDMPAAGSAPTKVTIPWNVPAAVPAKDIGEFMKELEELIQRRQESLSPQTSEREKKTKGGT